MSNDNFHARQNLVLKQGTGEKIKNTKILVVGAGAGANEVLKNLVLMGFGNLTIVDFDTIEVSNLSRTTLFTKEDRGLAKAEIAAIRLNQYVLHESPDIKSIKSKIEDVGKQVFLEHDIVVSCVDDTNARAYINDCCVLFGKPFLEMGFEKFVIQISFFPNEHSEAPCLRELIGMGSFAKGLNSCSKLKMDDKELQHIPSIQVAAAFAGVFVATEIVLYLQNDSKLKNKILQYAAEYHNCMVVDVNRNNTCFLHGMRTKDIYHSKFGKTDTFKSILEDINNKYKDEFQISFIEDSDGFVYSFECEHCQRVIPVKSFRYRIFDKERWCINCREFYEERPISTNWNIIKELNLINKNHKDYLEIPIEEFGFKEKDVVAADNLLNDRRILILLK